MKYLRKFTLENLSSDSTLEQYEIHEGFQKDEINQSLNTYEAYKNAIK